MKPFVIAAVVVLVIVATAACVRSLAFPNAFSRFLKSVASAVCVRSPADDAATEPVAYDSAAQLQIAQNSLLFLQENLGDSASFSAVTDAFAALCAEPTAGEEVLFEAGTYTFSGKPMFTVSLVRQIPDGNDEFYQIRAELSFLPDAENAGIEALKWLDPTDIYAFEAVRESDAFAYAETHTAQSVDLRIDET